MSDLPLGSSSPYHSESFRAAPPAPHAGTVGESERVERLEAALAQETFFANTRIAELEAELAMRKKEETRENRERESLERSIRITKDAITELDDGLCKILGITDKPAALDGLKAYLAELEARLTTPPPPSPDAKLGELVAEVARLEAELTIYRGANKRADDMKHNGMELP